MCLDPGTASAKRMLARDAATRANAMNPEQVRLAISLLAAHVLADFVIQTDKDVRHKNRFRVLLRHCLVAASLSYLLSGFWPAWPVPLTILVTHLALDLAKTKHLPARIRSFVLDQAAHFLVILVLSALLPSVMPALQQSLWQTILGANFYAALIVLTGFVITVQAGSVLVGFGVEPFLGELHRDEAANDRGELQPGESRRKGFEQGGKVIGQLERATIFVLVLAGQPSAIGFLIAAKSLLRFGEIGAGASRKEVEYIIIGTFMSFLLALVFSYITRFALLGYQGT